MVNVKNHTCRCENHPSQPIPAPEHSLVQLMGVIPSGFGFSHAMTVAAPQKGVFYGKRALLGSQAHCGHAPGALGSHQSQETLRSPGWPPLPLVYLQHRHRHRGE